MFVPETRGIPMEEVETVMFGTHWFWGKLVAETQLAKSSSDVHSSEGGDAADKEVTKV